MLGVDHHPAAVTGQTPRLDPEPGQLRTRVLRELNGDIGIKLEKSAEHVVEVEIESGADVKYARDSTCD